MQPASVPSEAAAGAPAMAGEASSLLRPYLDGFGQLQAALPGAAVPWLAARRAAGFARFSAGGFPTVRTEAWKYTNLRPLEKIAFAAAPQVPSSVSVDALPSVAAPGAVRHRAVLVDGRFRADLSSLDQLPMGVEVMSLAEAIETAPDRVEPHLGRLAGEDQPLAALNTAFFDDGLVVRIGRGVAAAAPIEIVFVGRAADQPVIFHPRLLIIAEAGSAATVVEHHVGIGDGVTFANVVAEIVVGAGAQLVHAKLQREGPEAFHLATTAAHLDRDAAYESFVLTLGARLSRNEIGVVLDGTGAFCRLDGAYLIRGEQHCDTTTLIDHVKPQGQSREVYKGVIDDRARAVFQGKIVVRPNAQKTDGYQLNRALLLSDAAEVDSKPELAIYADDVKCSHGATVGALDGDQLFYLRARGIDAETARSLLIAAFIGEAVDEIADSSVRNAFRAAVADWLAARGRPREISP